MSESTDLGAVVREFFPDADNEFIDYVLWEHTGFPSFWSGDPVECCRQQVKEFKEHSDIIDRVRLAIGVENLHCKEIHIILEDNDPNPHYDIWRGNRPSRKVATANSEQELLNRLTELIAA